MVPRTSLGSSPRIPTPSSKPTKTKTSGKKKSDKKRSKETIFENQGSLRLEALPNEIIAMIFRELGQPPKDDVYEVQNLDDVHPCYAVCSISSFFAEMYVVTMGTPSKEIAITLHPDDYMSASKSVETCLSERLNLLGSQGRDKVIRCHLIGSKIDRDTGVPLVDRWLSVNKVSKRLEPEHKVLIKQHVERDLNKKRLDIKNIFKVFSRSLKNVKDLKISPDETPVTVWGPLVKDYVFKHQDTLTTFKFVHASPLSWKYSYMYLSRLTKPEYFPNRIEQPSNYPSTSFQNRDGFEHHNNAIRAYLIALRNLQDLKIYVE